jgi:3-oxoacyl-[acyl-carrier protein] reductase
MLKGKTAVITGGSRGIGAAIALKFASLGADIALIYAGNEKAASEVCDNIRKFNIKAECFKCDVSDFEASKEAVASIKAAFGRIDILVNNAGITRDGLIAVMREDDFDEVLNINLKGAFNMIKHITPVFIRAKSGKIINISSVSGLMGNAGQANYSASKAGLIGLTKSVAKELASRNVTCNAIAPGFIETDMTRDFGQENPLLASIPLKRMGRPEEVAETAAFLAVSDYITGEVIRVDGGLAM